MRKQVLGSEPGRRRLLRRANFGPILAGAPCLDAVQEGGLSQKSLDMKEMMRQKGST
jgi:hypothetical protein